MNIDVDKALTMLLQKAINTSRPKSAGVGTIRYAEKGGYLVSDIRIISINVSIEYKTWTVEIAVKKDDEAANQMKRFKMSIPETNLPLWQYVQFEYMKRSCEFDMNDILIDDAEDKEQVSTDLLPVTKSDIDIIANSKQTLPIGSEKELSPSSSNREDFEAEDAQKIRELEELCNGKS